MQGVAHLRDKAIEVRQGLLAAGHGGQLLLHGEAGYLCVIRLCVELDDVVGANQVSGGGFDFDGLMGFIRSVSGISVIRTVVQPPALDGLVIANLRQALHGDLRQEAIVLPVHPGGFVSSVRGLVVVDITVLDVLAGDVDVAVHHAGIPIVHQVLDRVRGPQVDLHVGVIGITDGGHIVNSICAAGFIIDVLGAAASVRLEVGDTLEDIAVICYFDVDVHAVVAFVRIKVEVTGDDAVLTDRFFPKISRGIFGVSVQGHIIQRVRDRSLFTIHKYLDRDGGAVVLGLRVGFLVRQRHGDGVGVGIGVGQIVQSNAVNILVAVLCGDRDRVNPFTLAIFFTNFRNFGQVKRFIGIKVQPLVINGAVIHHHIQRRGADRGLRLREGDGFGFAIVIGVIQRRSVVQWDGIGTGLLRAPFQRDVVGQGHRSAQAGRVRPGDDVSAHNCGSSFTIRQRRVHIAHQLDAFTQRIGNQALNPRTDRLHDDIQFTGVACIQLVIFIIGQI